MTLQVLTIPDDETQWAGWLEQKLVGPHLADLVDELQEVRDADLTTSSPDSLQSVLSADQLRTVAELGLGPMDLQVIRQLLSSPECLLELQEHVLLNGSTYWTRVPRSDELIDSVQRVRRRLSTDDQPVQPATKAVATTDTSRSGLKLWWLLATVAVVVAGVLVWQQQPTLSGRILGQPGLLANDTGSSSEYLNRLAEAGEAWFDQRPRNTGQLVQLLKEVSTDCEILINAPHTALSPSEREWFVAKCRNWKSKFDETLVQLQTESLTFDEARLQADTVMLKLVNVLREGPPA